MIYLILITNFFENDNVHKTNVHHYLSRSVQKELNSSTKKPMISLKDFQVLITHTYHIRLLEQFANRFEDCDHNIRNPDKILMENGLFCGLMLHL